MANVTGLVPITGGVIRMALLSEKPQPHTTGSWEGQRVLAESVGHVLSWRASGLRYEDSTGSNSRTGAPSRAAGLRGSEIALQVQTSLPIARTSKSQTKGDPYFRPSAWPTRNPLCGFPRAA